MVYVGIDSHNLKMPYHFNFPCYAPEQSDHLSMVCAGCSLHHQLERLSVTSIAMRETRDAADKAVGKVRGLDAD